MLDGPVFTLKLTLRATTPPTNTTGAATTFIARFWGNFVRANPFGAMWVIVGKEIGGANGFHFFACTWLG